jgi:DNA-binding transcriptional ArsR family regulator
MYYKELSKYESRIVNTLGENLMYLGELEEATGLEFNTLKRPIKALTSAGIIDVEPFQDRTLYKLTDAGKILVEQRLEAIRASNGDTFDQPVYLHGTCFKDAQEAREYVARVLQYYSDGDLLSPEDFDIIHSCLVFTDNGRNLLNIGVLNIQVIIENGSYFLKVVTDTDDYDIIPLARLLGERKAYFHKKDVRKAFFTAIDIKPPAGFTTHNNPPFYGDIFKDFIKKFKIVTAQVRVKRINNKEELLDYELKTQWIEFYKEHANVEFIPDSEVIKIQKEVRISKINQRLAKLGV